MCTRKAALSTHHYGLRRARSRSPHLETAAVYVYSFVMLKTIRVLALLFVAILCASATAAREKSHPEEQSSFGEEEPFKHPVPLPNAVLKVLLKEARSQRCT